jgi:hypothetical protein
VCRFAAAEEAATALEFALVFPLFLMIVFVIWQLLILVNAAQVVSYAAFTAARSASVVIPTAVPGEGRNMLSPDPQSEKNRTIRRAAAIACAPISPPLGSYVSEAGLFGGAAAIGGPGAGVEDATTLGVLLGAADLNGPRVAQKAMYAAEFTDVQVTGPTQEGRFLDDAPLTVTVSHKFYLNVPYANRLFREGGFLGSRTQQRTLTAHYTIQNEGAQEVP